MVIVAGAGPADLPRLGVDLHGPLALQLFGDFVFDPAGSGRPFNGLPDIPISNFILHFKRNGLVINGRNLCTPPPLNFQSSFSAGTAPPRAPRRGHRSGLPRLILLGWSGRRRDQIAGLAIGFRGATRVTPVDCQTIQIARCLLARTGLSPGCALIGSPYRGLIW